MASDPRDQARPDVELTEEAVIASLNKAHAELAAAIQRQWDGRPALRISIPARPADDSDLVISQALRDALYFIEARLAASDPGDDRLARAEARIAELEACPHIDQAAGDAFDDLFVGSASPCIAREDDTDSWVERVTDILKLRIRQAIEHRARLETRE